jgi:hypothetical protein
LVSCCANIASARSLGIVRRNITFKIVIRRQLSRVGTMLEAFIEDVKIVGCGTRLADRLSSNGGVEISNAAGTVSAYQEGGVLPKENWSTLTDSELSLLTVAKSGFEASRTVQLLKMPAALLQISRALGLQNIVQQDEVQQLAIQRSEEFSEFMIRARSFGESFLSCKDGFFSQSVRCEQRIGLRSSTLDQKRGQFIGLHVDNWDALPMAMRENSRSRLILNLGKEPRFVVFINLTIAKMADLMIATDGTLQRGEVFDQIGKFFTKFANYPVTRLRVDPGEGYIAPVDNLYHDGTTSGKQSADITHSMLGHFCVKLEY